MSVKITCRVRDGWKATSNNRFGKCLEVVFINSKTGEEMFIYAPKLKDKHFFIEMFDLLEGFDNIHKSAINQINSINLFGEDFLKYQEENKKC